MNENRLFAVKANPRMNMFVEIIADGGESLELLIVCLRDGYHSMRRESMSRDLFDMCLRTGYLKPIRHNQALLSA